MRNNEKIRLIYKMVTNVADNALLTDPIYNIPEGIGMLTHNYSRIP